jgi:probable F420-dependent oxidoreductase
VKFGVTFPQTEIGTDPVAIREFAQAAEGAGFDYLVTYDHILGGHPDRFAGKDVGFPSPPYLYRDRFHEPFTLFAYLAAVTKRIELTTGIVILPQRQTALVAKQAAEVDLLSGQRLRLGVGIGWNFTEYEALNEDFHTRGARQEEQITVIRKLWAEELVTFEGRWHKLDRVGINPRPARRIPIWIGGGFKEPLLRRVARFADGWMPLLMPGQDAGPVIERLRYHLSQEGRDIASFGLQANVNTARGSETDWVNQAKQLRSLGVTHLGMGAIVRDCAPMAALSRAITAKDLIKSAIDTGESVRRD